jgi:hypothetical protein
MIAGSFELECAKAGFAAQQDELEPETGKTVEESDHWTIGALLQCPHGNYHATGGP